MTHIGDRPTREMYESRLEIDCQCARCGSSVHTEHCEYCEDGFDGHECGEDTCCCAYPEPNVMCQYCNGTGTWHRCLASREWCLANSLPGREEMSRGRIEWFTVGESE